MLDLHSFKNKHINEDIYILASGKSVDFIDNSFFKNKIVIGINQSYKKVHCSYLVRKERAMLKEVIQRCKDTIHFVSAGNCGNNNRENYNFIKNLKMNNNIVVYEHNPNTCEMPDKLPGKNELIVSYSTITTAIHLAAYMGAKNIILIGHDCGSINNECNFKYYHNDSSYKITWENGKTDYINWLKNIENQTIKLKGLLKKKYNCNIYSLNPFINFGLEGNKYSK
jgi:hypothetical protein